MRRNKMKNLKKIISSLLCSSILAVGLSSFNTYSVNISHIYDARNTYLKPLEYKHQQIDGPCWAFASIATLEGYLSKNGLLKNSLSEKHLLNWANRKSEPGWTINISNGGSEQIACGYLVSGDGPVLNNQCPYNCHNDCWESTNFIKPMFAVRGIKYLNSENIDEIKNAVVEYGAVHAGYDHHAFAIVGWNSKESYWIIKDSSSHAFNNYNTVPFSSSLSQLYCITNAKEYDDNEKIYQHDKFGVNSSYIPFSNSKLITANVFDISSDETLDSVMVESKAKGSNIKIYYAETLKDGSPNTDKDTWQEIYSGSIPYDGYHTYPLSKKVKMQKNNKVAIIVAIYQNEGTVNIGAQTAAKNINVKKLPKTSFEFNDYQNCFIELSDDLSIKVITKK